MDIDLLKGIGPKTLNSLNSLGVFTIDDLVNYMNETTGKFTKMEMIAGIWHGNNGDKKYDHYEDPFNVSNNYNLLKE